MREREQEQGREGGGGVPQVVDMFGCGLPVCAYKYDCIDELVANDVSGLLFSTPKELAAHFLRLFRGFPQQDNGLLEMRKNVARSVALGWDASWASWVQPVFTCRPPRGVSAAPDGAPQARRGKPRSSRKTQGPSRRSAALALPAKAVMLQT